MTQATVQPVQADAPPRQTSDRLIGQRLEVNWSRLLPPPELTPEKREGSRTTIHKNGDPRNPRLASFIISLEIFAEPHVEMSSWIDQPCGKQSISPQQAVDLDIHHEGNLRQIRATSEDKLLLLLVLDQDDQLVYVQAALPPEGGFLGGRYDPPTLRILPADS